jgi:hypothetical protein
MSRGSLATRAVLVASSLVVVLAAGGAWFVRRRARSKPAPVASGPASAGADPTWCGKPIGSRAVGQLKDPSICSKISLTGAAPTCFFWADCGELHFEIDCAGAGPGQCRCDGEEGRTVPYSPTFCTLDPEKPGAGLRTVLGSAATACRWSPK